MTRRLPTTSVDGCSWYAGGTMPGPVCWDAVAVYAGVTCVTVCGQQQ